MIFKNNRYEKILREIAFFLINSIFIVEKTPLNNDMLGALLFLFYYNKAYPDIKTERSIILIVEEVFKSAFIGSRSSNINTSNFKEIVSAVSILEHVTENKILDSDIREVLTNIDDFVYRSMMQDTLTEYIFNKEPLIGMSAFTIQRIRKDALYNNINDLKRMESLIFFVDKAASFFEKKIKNKHHQLRLLDLCCIAKLSAKILSMGIYCEITEQFLEKILIFFENDLSNRKIITDKTLYDNNIHILYSYFQIHQLLTERKSTIDIIETFLLMFDSVEYCQKNDEKIYEKKHLQIQQMIRLSFAFNNAVFKDSAMQLIEKRLPLYQTFMNTKRIGICGLSGLGLSILSLLSEDCVYWDEVLLLS